MSSCTDLFFFFIDREIQTNPAFGAKTVGRDAAASCFVVAFSGVVSPTPEIKPEIILLRTGAE